MTSTPARFRTASRLRSTSASRSCSAPSSSTTKGFSAGWLKTKSTLCALVPSPPAALSNAFIGACGMIQCPALGPSFSRTHSVRNLSSRTLSVASSASVAFGANLNGSRTVSPFMSASALPFLRAPPGIRQPSSISSGPRSSRCSVSPCARMVACSTPIVTQGICPLCRIFVSTDAIHCIAGSAFVLRRRRRIRVWLRSLAMTSSSSARRTVSHPGRAPIET